MNNKRRAAIMIGELMAYLNAPKSSGYVLLRDDQALVQTDGHPGCLRKESMGTWLPKTDMKDQPRELK